MLDTGNQWQLFGYDMRYFGKHWVAAWRNVLWADDSPVRARLGEVVAVQTPDALLYYQGGKPCAEAPYQCEAILLPDELVLVRQLRLPLAVEADLHAALALEVNANSPFAADDTGFGWQVVRRDDTHLHVALAIVSPGTVMAWLGREHDIHQRDAREVWADADGHLLVLQGFGEKSRARRYRSRLLRCGIMLAAAAVLVLLIAASAVGFKRAELAQMQQLAADTQREAADVSAMRAALALANQQIGVTNDIFVRYPNPHSELARLTELLGDEAHLVQFQMVGSQIRLRGRATDASTVMQKLTNEPAYASVTAPQAIVKLGNTGLEQFSLDITLAQGDAQ
tara:strand:- start:50979 stop:51995 length:1017 start_codon:yes stop_codon:yes gene_type:complete